MLWDKIKEKGFDFSDDDFAFPDEPATHQICLV